MEKFRIDNEFEFLIGKSIVEIQETGMDTKLICSDDTIITVEESRGECAGCDSGYSSIDFSNLSNRGNVIINIVVEEFFDKNNSDKFKVLVYYSDDEFEVINGDTGLGDCFQGGGGGFHITIENVQRG